MRDLNYQLKQLCKARREGSYASRDRRHSDLQLMANQLHGMGYRCMGAASLKRKHVQALVHKWLEQGLAPGTIKNRMASLRWWAKQVNKQNVVAKTNDFYAIPHRQFVTNTDKSQSVTEGQLDQVADEHVKISLLLQQAFGLRREEAIKFNPSYADKGDHLQLKASWTKGGKARTIPIRTEEQRHLLTRVRQLTGFGSLIPGHRNYVQQLRIYERHTARAGLSKLHGLRHLYAQQRYEELTSWPCPAAGGPTVNTLTLEQRDADTEARLIISQELGHTREAITRVYLGS